MAIDPQEHESRGPTGCPIELRNLSVEFQSARQVTNVRALDRVSLCIPAGEFLAVIGPSGCGKTTLLKAIGGLLVPGRLGSAPIVDGHVAIDGVSPLEAKNAGVFGFAFQNPVLLPWRTIQRNVALPLELRGSVNALAKATELLHLVGIEDFQDAHPSQLSGGMKQRANIARALVHDPRVLLLDEPFGDLDEVTRDRLNTELHRLHRITKPTVILVTHSLREACFLADRILVLSPRPATVASVIESTLPRTRPTSFESDPKFVDLLTAVRSAFVDGPKTEGAPV